MRLREILAYENIVIQCHDNPDADAIASGFGLYCYFKDNGKNVHLIYSGRNEIQKSNLKLMVEKLEIPIEYCPYVYDKETVKVTREIENLNLQSYKTILITTDCQYGAGNVTKLDAKNVAIIDHHQVEIKDIELSHIMPNMGSCSTVVYMLLKDENYDVTDENHLATALYYGLMTDTNSFIEIHNPNDRDMQDSLDFNHSDVTLFCNSNITLKELEIAGIAMLRYSFNDDYNFAVIKSQPCDSNVLGLISDFLLQVDQINSCVVFNEVPGGFKFSVRSSIREVNASELASYIAKDIGSGGGHYQKAGGFISLKLYEERYETTHAEAFFNNRMISYFDNYDLIYADKYEVNLDEMKPYLKKRIPVGYVIASDVLPAGTPIMIRTLEGDMDMVVEDDLVIMIGIEGEVYPNKLDKFNRKYDYIDGQYIYSECSLNNSYEPVITNRRDGKKIKISELAKLCVPTSDVNVYAKPLDKDTKVFTDWDHNRYMVGKEGDLLAVRSDDLHDVYIVDKDIFAKTYDEV